MREATTFLVVMGLLLPATAWSAPPDENKCDEASGSETEDLVAAMARDKRTAFALTYRALRKAKPTGDGAFTIGKREIDLPHGTLILDGGLVIPAQPCTLSEEDTDGKELPVIGWNGAVYLGTGRFHYDSPHPAESWQLNYTLEKLGNKGHDRESLDVALDGSLLFLGSEEWRNKLSEGGTASDVDKKSMKAAEKLWKDRADLYQAAEAHAETRRLFAPDSKEENLSLDVPTKDLKGVPALSFSLDDRSKEEVSIGVARRPNPLNRDFVLYNKIGAWFRPEVAAGKTEQQLGHYRMVSEYFDVQHYNLDMTLYKDEDAQRFGLAINGSMTLEVVAESLVGLDLGLISPGNSSFLDGYGYTIDTLTLDSDPGMQWVHDANRISVTLSRPFTRGEPLVFRISCKGPIVESVVQQAASASLDQQQAANAGAGRIINYRLPIGAPWFPTGSGGFEDAFTFEWVLRMPREMVASTSGTMVDSQLENDQRVQTIVETVPVFFPAIVFGRFTENFQPADPARGLPAIRLFTHPGFDQQTARWLGEASNVLQFYQQLFGPDTYPWQELDMVQMPIGVGYAQAPSGLVQMDGITFYSKTDLVNLYQADDNMLDIGDNFVPHEIGHFWWGHRAGWASGRDQWLSETLAEYSAALFIEAREAQKSGDPNDLSGYEHRKSRWGAEGRRGHTFKRTGPVWIGNTIDDSDELSPRRTSTIYARGPLIFDMLRQQFGKEWIFKALFTLNQVWAQNQNKAVTEDLQSVFEKLSPDHDWQAFMDDYIKGNAPLPDDPKKSVAEKQGKYKF